MMSRKWSGFIRCKQVANAAAFELEDALRLAAAEQGERLGVVERELVRIDPLAARLLDQLDALARIVRLRRPRKSIFKRPAASTSPIAHCVMTSVLPFTYCSGTYSIDRLLGDHHRRRVRADVAGQAFDLQRQVDQLADFAVGVVGLLAARRSASSASSSVMPSCSGTIATI